MFGGIFDLVYLFIISTFRNVTFWLKDILVIFWVYTKESWAKKNETFNIADIQDIIEEMMLSQFKWNY